MAKNIMVPGTEMGRRLDYEAWKAGDEEVPWIDEVFGMLDQMDQTYKQFQVHWPEAKRGPWSLEHHAIPKRHYERLYHVCSGVHPSLDRDTGYGDITVLKRDGKVWMSDTRAEIMEHIPLLNKLWWLEHAGTEKIVLINGLGLGMAVNAALKYGFKVDVVEIDPDVIGIIGPNFDQEVYEGKVTIHHTDAFDIEWSEDKHWTLAWHDIWQAITEDNLPEMARLHLKYRYRVQWQASWQEEACKRHWRNSREFEKTLKAGDWQRAKELDPEF